jgi:hypothetical protein
MFMIKLNISHISHLFVHVVDFLTSDSIYPIDSFTVIVVQLYLQVSFFISSIFKALISFPSSSFFFFNSSFCKLLFYRFIFVFIHLYLSHCFYAIYLFANSSFYFFVEIFFSFFKFLP